MMPSLVTAGFAPFAFFAGFAGFTGDFIAGVALMAVATMAGLTSGFDSTLVFAHLAFWAAGFFELGDGQ